LISKVDFRRFSLVSATKPGWIALPGSKKMAGAGLDLPLIRTDIIS